MNKSQRYLGKYITTLPGWITRTSGRLYIYIAASVVILSLKQICMFICLFCVLCRSQHFPPVISRHFLSKLSVQMVHSVVILSLKQIRVFVCLFGVLCRSQHFPKLYHDISLASYQYKWSILSSFYPWNKYVCLYVCLVFYAALNNFPSYIKTFP